MNKSMITRRYLAELLASAKTLGVHNTQEFSHLESAIREALKRIGSGDIDVPVSHSDIEELAGKIARYIVREVGPRIDA